MKTNLIRFFWWFLTLMALSMVFITTNAQQQKLDSLLKVYNNYKKTDTAKANLLITATRIALSNNAKNGLDLVSDLAQIGRELNYSKAIGSALLYKGLYFQTKLQIDSAESYYNQTISYAKNAQNKSLEMQANGNMASVLLIKGNSSKALETLQQTIDFFDSSKDYTISGKFMVNLANIYNVMGNRTLALKTAIKAVEVNTNCNELNAAATANYLVGTLYGTTAQFKEALQYHKAYAALQMQFQNWQNACSGLIAVANDYNKLQKTDSTIIALEMALVIAKANNIAVLIPKIQEQLNEFKVQTSSEEDNIETLERQVLEFETKGLQQDAAVALLRLGSKYSTISDAYLTKKQLDKDKKSLALKYVQQALVIADNSKNINLKESCLRAFSTIYEQHGDFINAYNTYKNYIIIRDSATSVANQLEIAKLGMQYNFSKTEDSLKLKQANTNALLQKQFYVNEQQKQNIALQNKTSLLDKQTILAGNQKLSILSKDKELQHLAYLNAQAQLQTAEIAKKQKDNLLNLAAKDKQLTTVALKNASQQNENNILKRKQIIGYGLASVATLLFGIFTYYNRKQSKQKQLNSELAIEKAEQDLLIANQKVTEAELQNKITEVSLTALRSQMNPHFIFNSLNSINSVVVEGNVPLASDYLTKFSKLIRLILDNSTQSLIPLSKEVEALKLYLLMESIRFKNKFAYSITVDDLLDTDNILIAPTTLQPFVENAILHGIMHLNKPGEVKVKIESLQKNCIQITIDDNGVGRTKAAELKSRTNVNKSHGYQITIDRIKQINSNNSITIYDKVDNTLQANGTTVVIKWHC
jgi:LytS/YehU family sensor histidine kinase